MDKKIFCPECGAETIVETISDFMGSYPERRCTGLVEVDPNKQLEACTWSEVVTSKKNKEVAV